MEEPFFIRLDNIRILLVEDNKINQRVTELTLKKWGIQTDIADSGAIALEMLNRKPYNLILMDIQMQGMDGFETTRFIRNHQREEIRNTPVMALTASGKPEEAQKCFEAGMEDYIFKPFNTNELYNKIIKLVNRVADPVPLTEETAHTASAYLFTDISYVRNLGRGNNKYVREMIGFFLESTPQAIRDMKEAYETENFEMINEIAHKIRPSFTMMGIKSLEKEIALIERYARENKNLDEIGRLLDYVSDTAEKVYKELEDQLALFQD